MPKAGELDGRRRAKYDGIDGKIPLGRKSQVRLQRVSKSPEIVAFIKEHHDELDADEIRRSMSKFIEYLSFKRIVMPERKRLCQDTVQS